MHLLVQAWEVPGDVAGIVGVRSLGVASGVVVVGIGSLEAAFGVEEKIVWAFGRVDLLLFGWVGNRIALGE